MLTTLALAGDALHHGHMLLAAGDDLTPTDSGAVNLNLSLWSTIVGFVSPLVVALLQQPRWAPFVRAVITVAFCILAAAGTAAVEGQLNGTRWTTSTLIVLAAAIGTYQTLWKNVAPRLEAATSTGRHAAADPA